MSILTTYQDVSGQRINLDKSEMVFSPNVTSYFKKSIQEHLPVKISENLHKYLGMSINFGRSKEQHFQFIMDKIWKKLKGWKEKNLSFEGRGVLIRAVAQALPTYYMSCFMLSKGLCSKIEKSVCSFWWGTKRKIHWTKNENLFKSKHMGDLGFKTLREFNYAMLAKQAWRFPTNPTSLIAKVFKAKYFPHSDVLQAPTGCNPSYAWRSIHSSIWVILKGSCLKIRDGNSIRIWEDNWIPSHNNFKVLSPKEDNSQVRMVKDLILTNPLRWNSDYLNTHFLNIDKEHIEQIPLIGSSHKDELMWMFEPNGVYSVKSGYRAIKE